MTKTIKRLRETSVDRTPVPLDEALSRVIGGSGVKFDETVDVAVQLGVDTRKSDQSVRGSVVLPAGTGKRIRIGVVAAAEGDREAAKAAGADIVGYEDLIASIGEGKLDFDVLVATPEAMRALAAVAKVLGPRGLMPNPKNDTVSKEVAEAVQRVRSGQVNFRADKTGIVHAPVGKASFPSDRLKQNVESLLAALKKAKPSSSKGVYLRGLALSSTMGRSVRVDISSYR